LRPIFGPSATPRAEVQAMPAQPNGIDGNYGCRFALRWASPTFRDSALAPQTASFPPFPDRMRPIMVRLAGTVEGESTTHEFEEK